MISPETIYQDALEAWQSTGTGQDDLVIEHAGTSTRLKAKQVDTVGAVYTGWKVHREPAASTEAWAEAVASQSRGLMEPLTILEMDQQAGHAVLRSNPPRIKDQDRDYYEVELQGTTDATLQRYRGSTVPGSSREAIPFPLTHEAAAGLLDTLGHSAPAE
jgi:hypothetical protein